MRANCFIIDLKFTENYPDTPPRVMFKKKTIPFHPNVYTDGAICLSMLKTSGHLCWKKQYGIRDIILQLIELLKRPNFDDPANAAAAQLRRKDPKAYVEKIKKMTQTTAAEAYSVL